MVEETGPSGAPHPPSYAGPSSDDSGFRDWAAARRPAMRATAFLLCGDWHLADDVVQEALTSVYVRWSRVSAGDNVDAYARRVLVSRFLDSRRRPWRREVTTETLPDSGDRAAAAALEQVDALAGQTSLTRCLRLLPPRQRAALVLRYLEDLSVEQVAAALGCSPVTVRSHTSRGLDRLRLLLAGSADVDGFSRGATSSTAPPGRVGDDGRPPGTGGREATHATPDVTPGRMSGPTSRRIW